MDEMELFIAMEVIHPGIITGSLSIVCDKCGGEFEANYNDEELYECMFCGHVLEV